MAKSLRWALWWGSHGIRWRVPRVFVTLQRGEFTAEFMDPLTGAIWALFYRGAIHLDLREGRRAQLDRTLEWHARGIFASIAAADDEYEGPSPADDPTWSPFVEREYGTIDGAPCLRHLCWMACRPGKEVLAGHVLVPLARGTFVARCIITGAGDANDTGAPSVTSSAKILDAALPLELVSRAREIQRRFMADAGVRVLRPGPPRDGGRIEGLRGHWSIVTPPGFVYSDGDGYPRVRDRIERISFSASEGVETLGVKKLPPLERREKLAKAAQRYAEERTKYQEDVTFDVEQHENAEGRERVVIVTNGKGYLGLTRYVMVFFLDPDPARRRVPWVLTIVGSRHVPLDNRIAELLECADTWEHRPKAKPIPWWKRLFR